MQLPTWSWMLQKSKWTWEMENWHKYWCFYLLPFFMFFVVESKNGKFCSLTSTSWWGGGQEPLLELIRKQQRGEDTLSRRLLSASARCSRFWNNETSSVQISRNAKKLFLTFFAYLAILSTRYYQLIEFCRDKTPTHLSVSVSLYICVFCKTCLISCLLGRTLLN